MCVCVCAHTELLLRPVAVCGVSAVRMKTLSISIQQQLVLTTFCLLPNALQLISKASLSAHSELVILTASCCVLYLYFWHLYGLKVKS